MSQIQKSVDTNIFSSLTIYDAIKPIYYISRLLQVWPYKYKNNKPASLSNIEKCFGLAIIVGVIIYVAWSTYGKIVYAWDKKFPSPVICDVIFTSPLHFLVAFSIFLANFKQIKLTLSFYEGINSIDKRGFIMPQLTYSKFRMHLIKKISALFLTVTLMSVCDLYLTAKLVGYRESVYFLCLYVSYYPAIAVMIQVLHKADAVKEKFEIINNRLQALFRNQTVDAIDTKGYKNIDNANIFYSKSKPNHIRSVCKVHIKLCDLMDMVSDTHGLQTALLFCCFISAMLLALNYGLWTDDLTATRSELLMVPLFKFASVLMYFCPAVMIAKACSSAADEAFATGTIAHNILLDIPVGTNDPHELLIREELDLIIQQVGQRKSSFSAGGFFPVDFTIIYGVIGAVTSYFIVLLQFKGSPPPSEST